MLSSRDSGAKVLLLFGTHKFFSYFIGFFSISFKNQGFIGCDQRLLPAFRHHLHPYMP